MCLKDLKLACNKREEELCSVLVQEQVELDNSNKDNCCNFIIKRNYHLLDFKKLFIVVLLICRVSNSYFC